MERRLETWANDQAYEQFMGRWSRLVAPLFLDWLPAAEPGAAWCDVGCGTGSLSHAILATRQPGRVVGIEPSVAFLAAAERDANGPFEAVVGSATAIPAGDGEFDRTVSGLVLNFVPQPEQAARELRRVTKPGGPVGAYVWDYAEGMRFLRTFWDAANQLVPDGTELDEGSRFVVCRPDELSALFSGAGLADVRVEGIEIPTTFTDFDDYWSPFLGAQGPAPTYVAGLDDEHRRALRDLLRSTLGDGEIRLTARAWAIRGVNP